MMTSRENDLFLPLLFKCCAEIILIHMTNGNEGWPIFLNIGTQGVQELFFCDLKAPGGCSTLWTHKGNSFMYTGVPDSSQCHYKV